MTPQEIHSRLAARFGAAIAEWQAPETGDAWIGVEPGALRDVCRYLRDESDLYFDGLRLITGMDRGEKLGAVYHLYSYRNNHDVVLHADVSRDDPRVPSVTSLWPAAEWHEREAYDMIGLLFEGHADLRRILLPDDWDGFPLRKDYESPKTYHGLTNE